MTDLPHMTNYKNLSNGKIIIDFLDQIAISGNLISFRKKPKYRLLIPGMYYVHSLRLSTFCSFPVMRSFPFDHFRSTVKLFSMFEDKNGNPGQRIATSKFWIPIREYRATMAEENLIGCWGPPQQPIRFSPP